MQPSSSQLTVKWTSKRHVRSAHSSLMDQLSTTDHKAFHAITLPSLHVQHTEHQQDREILCAIKTVIQELDIDFHSIKNRDRSWFCERVLGQLRAYCSSDLRVREVTLERVTCRVTFSVMFSFLLYPSIFKELQVCPST